MSQFMGKAKSTTHFVRSDKFITTLKLSICCSGDREI